MIEIRKFVYEDPRTQTKKEVEVQYDTDDKSVVIELQEPMEFGTERYTEIRLKTPTWEQIESIDMNNISFPTIRKMATKLSGLDSARLGKIQGKDIRNIMTGVMYFLHEALADPI